MQCLFMSINLNEYTVSEDPLHRGLHSRRIIKPFRGGVNGKTRVISSNPKSTRCMHKEYCVSRASRKFAGETFRKRHCYLYRIFRGFRGRRRLGIPAGDSVGPDISDPAGMGIDCAPYVKDRPFGLASARRVLRESHTGGGQTDRICSRPHRPNRAFYFCLLRLPDRGLRKHRVLPARTNCSAGIA